MLVNILVSRKTVVLIDVYSTLSFHYAWISSIFCRLLNLPYICIIHGGDFPKRILKSKFLVNKFLFKYAYKIIAPSNYLKSNIEAITNYKIQLIPNSIDLEKYSFKQRSKLKIKLLWVRSFHKIYNPNLALDVLEELHKQGFRNGVLCMVGPKKDNSLVEFKKLVIEKRLEKFVTITGKLEKEKWLKLSEKFDFFLNTTNVDNTPVSVIEAMALGLNVISTNVGGIPFMLNNNIDSVLVKPNSSKGFVKNIIELVQTPKKAELLRTNAREKVKNWDKKVIIKKWKKIICDTDN
tara:strand:- start:191 stop:1069 length:879 start_codon:yes stop_codon:yes gene_type:complete